MSPQMVANLGTASAGVATKANPHNLRLAQKLLPSKKRAKAILAHKLLRSGGALCSCLPAAAGSLAHALLTAVKATYLGAPGQAVEL